MTGRLLSGVFPIVATPFRADGSPDVGDLARVVEFIVDAGADGLVFPGVASEFETLEPEERRVLVEAVARAQRADGFRWSSACQPRKRRTPRRHAAQARAVGAAAVMAVAPPTMREDDRLRRSTTTAASPPRGLPIILQNAPPPAGCGFSPERVAEIVAAVPRHRVRQGGNAALRPADHAAARADAGPGSACSAARADATSPTSSRAALVARCRHASSTDLHVQQFARAPRRRRGGGASDCSRECCRCSISRPCSAWR